MTTSRPNMLLFFTDQQRFDSLGANGNTICQTPHADRLAEEGMNFSHAFTVSALCSPARASLLTGLYPHNHTLVDNTNMPNVPAPDLPDHLNTFSTMLKDAGYCTGYVGKWHAGRSKTPRDWGFVDYVRGAGGHAWQPGNIRLEDESPVRLAYAPDKPMHARVPRPLEEYPEFRRADEAIALLNRYSRQDRPFFFRVDFFGPHYPHYLPEPYASMYDPSRIPPWPNFNDPLQGAPYGTRWLLNRWAVPDRSWETVAGLVARYFGHVTCLDHQMGRILDAVETLGLADTTMVVFTSDHGDMTGSHGLIQKGACAYDELYHIPLIARWPGEVERGTRCEAMAHLFDLMPTFLAAAGIAPPKDLDARSLIPLLRGRTPSDWRQEIFAEYLATQPGDIVQKILRTRRHKLSLNTPGPDELFDLERDPGEMRNVIADPAYADQRRDLACRLRRRMIASNDPLLPAMERRLVAYINGLGMTAPGL